MITVCQKNKNAGNRRKEVHVKIIMIVNDTNFAWNLRREVLETFVERGWQTILLAQILDFKSDFEKLGVSLIDIHIDRRGTNPFSDICILNQYIRILKREKPDIVLTNNIKPNIYAGLACQRLKIKYIVNVTGLGTAVEIPNKLQRLSIFLYKLGIKRASTLFFQNSDNQHFFHQHKMVPLNAKEVLLPGSGVNLKTHPVFPWPDGPIRFLYAARVMKEKGIDYFIAAAKKYASKDVYFDICGQCDDPKYKSLLESEPSVNYFGLQKDMTPFYAACSCFLYPSYYPEGMSNVLLEAAACGRPVIAADRAGCRETVDDGISGFVVPIKNEEAVFAAVEKILYMTSDERKNMGLSGRKKIEQEFDREIVIQEYINEITELFSTISDKEA